MQWLIVLRMYLGDIVKPIPFHSRILEHISCSFVSPSKVHFDLRRSENNENLPSQSLHWTRHDRRHFVNMYHHLCPSPSPHIYEHTTRLNGSTLWAKPNLVGERLENVYEVKMMIANQNSIYTTSNSSHYICPRVGYDVFYAMNCTILISKYVYFFLLAGY